MKKNLLLFTISFFLTGFLYSQKSDTIITRLTGRWIWVESNDGWGGHYSPQTVGYDKSVILYQEQTDIGTDSISYLTFKNDSIIQTGRTYIDSNKIFENVIVEDTIVFNISHYFSLHFYNNDSTLTFSPPAFDVYVHRFIKDFTYNSINQPDRSNFDFKLFPNPSSDFLQIEYNAPDRLNSNIEILNSIGQQILTYKFSSNSTINKIDISSLSKGFYILRLTNCKIIISKTFIIE